MASNDTATPEEIKNAQAVLEKNKELLDLMAKEKTAREEAEKKIKDMEDAQKKQAEEKQTVEQKVRKMELKEYEREKLNKYPELAQIYQELEYPVNDEKDIDKAIAKAKSLQEKTKATIEEEKQKKLNVVTFSPEKQQGLKDAMKLGGEKGIEAYLAQRRQIASAQ